MSYLTVLDTPTLIAVPSQFRSISAGWNHGCALGSDDSAYCWGYGVYGQLGNGAYDDTNVPVRVVLGPATGFSAIAAGRLTSCALQKGTPTAYCWGQGSSGQLGNDSSDDTNVPVAVSGGRSFTGIDVGQDSACAVAVDDSAYCWGWGDSGQLGNGRSGRNVDDSSTVPVLVLGSYRFVEVSVGGQFACGVTSVSGDDTGPGVCWGKNDQGQLGNGSTDDSSNIPVIVDDTAPGVLTLRSIAAGSRHACAISVDDSAYCWGDGSNGQLGNGSSGGGYRQTRPTRVLIPGDAPVRDISAGSESSCAITDDTTYCWGWQAYGQLGNGQTGAVARAVPVAVTLSGIGAANSPVQVTSGEAYNAFIVRPRMTFAGTAFPSAQVGQSTSTLVPVQNTRPWTITITGTSVTGAGVSVTPSGTTCSGALPSGATCTVSLAWTPASIGALNGASLTVNYVGNSSSTPLTGNGTDPTPPTPIPPSAPGSVAATAGDASATVTWTAPTSPGSFPVTNYQVTSSPGEKSCLTSALTCTVTGLTNGTTYTFTVKALSGAGWGASSAPSNAVTPQAPPPPPKPSILITGSRDGQRITVTGTAMHLTSQTVRPWIKFPGQPTYSEGAAVIPVSADGTFTWSRRSGKKIYVYIAHGTARSNMVTIPAR
jgi:alpha-tubulin suppressor-like RCC1 family protein